MPVSAIRLRFRAIASSEPLGIAETEPSAHRPAPGPCGSGSDRGRVSPESGRPALDGISDTRIRPYSGLILRSAHTPHAARVVHNGLRAEVENPETAQRARGASVMVLHYARFPDSSLPSCGQLGSLSRRCLPRRGLRFRCVPHLCRRVQRRGESEQDRQLGRGVAAERQRLRHLYEHTACLP